MAADDSDLDLLHHTAVVVDDVARAVAWYRERFRCRVVHEDPTWALLRFRNAHLALVVEEQHPRHVAFVTPDAETRYGPLSPHRDGTRSTYLEDCAGNAVEVFSPDSIEG